MFLQLVMPPIPYPFLPSELPALSAAAQQYLDSLFVSHPLKISALVETVWRNRYNAASTPTALNTPFEAWPPELTAAILNDTSLLGYFPPGSGTNVPLQLLMPQGETYSTAIDQPEITPLPLPAPQTPPATNWDHLIYALCVENTRIFDIFGKVLETYMFTEKLETPSPATQAFLRNTEYLLFSDTLPSMVWTTSSRLRRDEMANRMTTYYRMFGMDLAHAAEIAGAHPYEKPDAANREFIPTFEAFAREVWTGRMNAENTSGANPTDDEAIATSARRLYDMLNTRRLFGNISREEFRAVACMSWLHAAIMYNSPIVEDMRATATSPELRLMKMGDAIGIKTHPKTKPLLDLSQDFSFLLQSIETGVYNQPASAALLYTPGTTTAASVEIVIDQYCLATDRDLKAPGVSLTPRAITAPPLRLSPPGAAAAPHLAPAARAARPNGHAARPNGA